MKSEKGRRGEEKALKEGGGGARGAGKVRKAAAQFEVRTLGGASPARPQSEARAKSVKRRTDSGSSAAG